MRRLLFAALVVISSPLVLAQSEDKRPVERGHLGIRTSEKSVLLRYDIVTSAVTAVTETASLENVIDMNPAHALSGTYAVIVAGDGSSFVKPAPVMVRQDESAIFVLVPFSAAWDAQSVTVNNLPSAGTAPRTFTVDGDLLLSRTDVALANSLPALKPHRFRARTEWCIEPTRWTETQFDTSGGGHVCFACISCSDGTWETCGNPYGC
jgi:hypothetical protein